MKIAIPKERRAGEARVAASPDTVRKLVALGLEVIIEKGAGEGASIPDEEFTEAGAAIAGDEALALGDADIVFKVQRPLLRDGEGPDELSFMKEGSVLIGMLAQPADRRDAEAYAGRKITAFALELLPRITRAQSMDVLSSQSSLTGYKAVLDAAAEFGRAMPMMMTAAGTVAPARVVVLGAGVAGLQAIATARRLGAVVSAFDVRAAAREEVESLGATFIEVSPEEEDAAETAAGYAREMGEDYQRKQAAVIHETLKKQDIAICTALIPGRPAPVLITEEMVKSMKPGAVIVDLAVEAGGNCELSEYGKVVTAHGVKILGHANVPSRIAVDASALYARNLLNFLSPLIDVESKELKIDWEDEIVKGTLLTRDGKIVHPALTRQGNQ
ncbi:MAG: Re/Si-specific NAD(P)(+) transhydrogenase subunit alpha [Alphaproteobacteria bacterium]